MSRDVAFILDECLGRIRAGASVQECLAGFPAEAEKLAPLLETLMAVRELKAIEPPLPERVLAGRERFLARAAQLRRQEAEAQPSPFAAWLSRLGHSLATWIAPRPLAGRWVATAVITLLLLVVLGGGAVVAAETSLPGDPLYPVKRTTQAVRLSLALDETTRAELERQIQAQRRADALAVAEYGRQVRVDFSGEIESLREDAWVVSGVPLVVDAQTVIEGPRQPGLPAEILALSQGDGTLRAQHIIVATPTPAPTPTQSPFVPAGVTTETATTAPTDTAPPPRVSVATSPPTFTATSQPTVEATATSRPTFTATWTPTVPATVTARPPTTTATPRPATPRPDIATPKPPTATPRPPTATSTPRPPTPTDTPAPITATPHLPTPAVTRVATAVLPTATWVPTAVVTDTARPRFTATWAPTDTATPARRAVSTSTATLAPRADVTRAPTATGAP